MAFVIVALGAHDTDLLTFICHGNQLIYGFLVTHVYSLTTEVLTFPVVLDISLGKLALEGIFIEMRAKAGLG